MARTTLAPGIVTDARTAAMLAEVQRRFGQRLYYAQGSYRGGRTAASGSTHDGGGAVDVRTVPLGSDHKAKMRLVKLLRQVGFAAWYREAIPGTWGEHIHAIAIGCDDLSSGARWQVGQFLLGHNGLSNIGPDPQPQFGHKHRTWEKYQRRNPRVTRRARMWGTPYDKKTKLGVRKPGSRVMGAEDRLWKNAAGRKKTWLRDRKGRWVKAARTDWRKR